MTTGKVLQFPSRVEKDWIEKNWIEREKDFRDQASAKGYPDEKVDAVCRRLKKHHSELAPLTELKMAFTHPAGLSEEQIVPVRDFIRQMEIQGREKMSILLSKALMEITLLEFAWEIYRENDKGI